MFWRSIFKRIGGSFRWPTHCNHVTDAWNWVQGPRSTFVATSHLFSFAAQLHDFKKDRYFEQFHDFFKLVCFHRVPIFWHYSLVIDCELIQIDYVSNSDSFLIFKYCFNYLPTIKNYSCELNFIVLRFFILNVFWNYIHTFMFFCKQLLKLHTRPATTRTAVSTFIRSHQQAFGIYTDEWTPVGFEPSIFIVNLFHLNYLSYGFTVSVVYHVWNLMKCETAVQVMAGLV